MSRLFLSLLSLILLAIISRSLMPERATAQSASSKSSSIAKTSSDPKPSPTAEPNGSPADGTASLTPESIWTREELSSDWGGTRKKWEEHGVSFELKPRAMWLWLFLALLFTVEIYSAVRLLGPNQFDELGAPCITRR